MSPRVPPRDSPAGADAPLSWPSYRERAFFDEDSIISGSLPYPDGPRPRDFHAHMTRDGRAQAVLATHRQRLRKRYAALVAVLAIPAMASATEWPTTPQPAQAISAPIVTPHLQQAAAYTQLGDPSQIHSDTEASTLVQDAIGGPAARPFVESGSEMDRARAEQCLTMAIYYEAATQPDDGQRAVAQVVLNRVAHPSFPNTVCGVVFQGSERNTGCQFTFTCDGSLARQPMAYWWDRARRVARTALAGFVYTPVGLATHYHTLQVHPYWDDSMVPVVTIGAHRFFRWPGAAGQKAAFRVVYLGAEPAAVRHPRAFTPAADSDPDPVALARAYEASLPHEAPLAKHPLSSATGTAAAPEPIYSADVQARGGDTLFRASNLPDSGGLSPELQRSGQWLQRP